MYLNMRYYIKCSQHAEKYVHALLKLGLMIDSDEIELQNHILGKIKDFPEKLSDKKQLQRFLGILNYAEGFTGWSRI